MDIQDYIGLPRDTKRERELTKKLQNLDSEECFGFLLKYIELDEKVGLMLANRCLREKLYFQKILQIGLDNPDASRIKYWFECCLPRLGAKSVFSILSSKSIEKPREVLKSIYWAKILISEEKPEFVDKINDLEKSIRDRIISESYDS